MLGLVGVQRPAPHGIAFGLAVLATLMQWMW
jgi:hypothetical protein